MFEPSLQRLVLPRIVRAQSTSPDSLRTSLAEGLDVTYTVVIYGSTANVHPSNLAPMGLDETTVGQVARQNLTELLEEQGQPEIDAPFSILPLEGARSPALLLLDSLWDSLERSGPLWVAVPEREILMAGPLDSLAPSIRTMVQRTFEDKHNDGLSPRIYQRIEGRWTSI